MDTNISTIYYELLIKSYSSSKHLKFIFPATRYDYDGLIIETHLIG